MKHPALRHIRGCFFSVPFCAPWDAYRVLLTYDCLNNPKPVKQVVVATKVIVSNRCPVWTMYLCMYSIKCRVLVLCGGGTILWQSADNLGALLSGSVLLLGTLRYIQINLKEIHHKMNKVLQNEIQIKPLWSNLHIQDHLQLKRHGLNRIFS